MTSLGGDLSLREKASGGGVAESVSENPPRWMRRWSRVVILVHGYNNGLCAGCRSYGAFLGNAPTRFPKVGRFFWPGDLSVSLLSAASYSWKIRTAEECAEKLAEFLVRLVRSRTVPIEIDFIGHSLGCRLVLETLRKAAGSEVMSHVRVVCLMAAAVPVTLVSPGYCLEKASRGVPARLVLYSPNDKVLRWSFPIGQALAAIPWIGDEHGVYLRAVGLEGKPAGYPTASAQMTGNDHSDYWSDERIFRHISPLLGVARERGIEERWLPGRDTPEPPPPTLRLTPERGVGQAWHSECEGCG
jgi:pimeloyl-ACP methyl ester carboxylesterase